MQARLVGEITESRATIRYGNCLTIVVVVVVVTGQGDSGRENIW
jgi:hypothetical protein